VRRRLVRRAAGLTDREVEVLRLIARGMATRQVGRALRISPSTEARRNSGPLATPQGEVPPTGVHVKVPFASVVRVVGHRIASVHLRTDQATFASQLGLLPTPA
jgi:Bacterial regulatory proteins, luxR family